MENQTSIHCNITEANNSRPKGRFLAFFQGGIWAVCLFFKATLNNQSFTSIPCMVIFGIAQCAMRGCLQKANHMHHSDADYPSGTISLAALFRAHH